MPSKADREAFQEAIKNNNQDQIRVLLQQDDAKELLLMKDGSGYLPIHDACIYKSDKANLQLILDAAVKHGVAKQALEEKTYDGVTFLHHACFNKMSPYSLRLLLEYLSKHADIKKYRHLWHSPIQMLQKEIRSSTRV